MKSTQQSEIIRRLHCAAGHLNAVIEMAEAGQPSEQVLHQLNAVKSALHIAGAKLMICQAESSQAIILNSPSAPKRLSELKRLQSMYALFIQYRNHQIEDSHD